MVVIVIAKGDKTQRGRWGWRGGQKNQVERFGGCGVWWLVGATVARTSMVMLLRKVMIGVLRETHTTHTYTTD